MNSRVLDYVRKDRPSAHSDVAEVLARIAGRVDGVRCYCPDPERYAYVVAYRVDLKIIGLAFGSSGLAFRVPRAHVQSARCAGGTDDPRIGPEWVRFAPWAEGESTSETLDRLARWCRVAAIEEG